MRMKMGDLNLRIAPKVRSNIPKWFNTGLEFDFPVRVGAGMIALVKEYGGHTVVVLWLWKSRIPPPSEIKIGEVIFRNEGTEEAPSILHVSRKLDGAGPM